MDLKYIRRVNGINPNKTLKDMEIDEMVYEYNEAKENVITKFQLRIRSTDAVDVTINNSKNIKKALIENNTNKPTKLEEYEKLIQMYPNELRTGYYIYIKDEKYPYIVVSAIDKENGYEEAKIKQCNFYFKIKDSDGNVVSTPAYYENQTMYNIGIKRSEASQIGIGDTIVKVLMNSEWGRKYLYRDSRFMLMTNGRATPYKSTYLDSAKTNIDQEGLLIFQASESKLLPEDDEINLIAHNHKENNNLPIKPNDLIIEGDDLLTIKSEYEVDFGSKQNFSGVDFTFTVDRPDFARVEKINNKMCILYGLKEKEYVTLTATSNDGSIVINKDILIKAVSE